MRQDEYFHTYCRAKLLPLLFKVSHAMDSKQDLHTVLEIVMQILGEHMGVKRAMLSILNRSNEEIFIESSLGLDEAAQARGVYRVGEGIIGTVVATGKPVMIQRVSQSKEFLNKTGSRDLKNEEDISFICVPIRLGREVIGTLSIDREVEGEFSLEHDMEVLAIISTMIAQAVQLHQLEHEENDRLREENLRLKGELKERFRPSNIIGNSKPMQKVYDLIEKISTTASTVLILGQSGSGKELVAQAIHYNSPRNGGPFIKFNCAALAENIIESELFGHEKGAFTGAVESRRGRFEDAHGGTLFMDEVGELSMPMQTKLLRVLQEREFERVGGNKTIKVDIRIIAATNVDLEQSIKEAKFREDLYYRLNVFPIHIPSLHERGSDILLLADFFVQKYSEMHGRRVRRISTPAIDMLMSYHWPGNVRELENVIERAVILSDDDVIHAYHLPPSLQTSTTSGTQYRGTLQAKLDMVEKETLIEALKNCHGNMAQAAKTLGLTERVMGLRVKKYEVDFRVFRQE